MERNEGSEEGRRIRRAMKAAGFTQARTASEAGIPASTFTRKLAGEVEFTTGEVADIARVLGVRTISLMPSDDMAVAA